RVPPRSGAVLRGPEPPLRGGPGRAEGAGCLAPGGSVLRLLPADRPSPTTRPETPQVETVLLPWWKVHRAPSWPAPVEAKPRLVADRPVRSGNGEGLLGGGLCPSPARHFRSPTGDVDLGGGTGEEVAREGNQREGARD